MSASVRAASLHGFYSAEFHALFVRGYLVTLSHVEVVPVHRPQPSFQQET
jgi:hypothetical protein